MYYTRYSSSYRSIKYRYNSYDTQKQLQNLPFVSLPEIDSTRSLHQTPSRVRLANPPVTHTRYITCMLTFRTVSVAKPSATSVG